MSHAPRYHPLLYTQCTQASNPIHFTNYFDHNLSSINMSTSYTISVENQRGENTNYAVFMNPPDFTGGQQPWMNVWYTSFVPYHGSFEVRTGADFYACRKIFELLYICPSMLMSDLTGVGTVPTAPAPGVIVNSGMSLLARLGTAEVPGSEE